MRTLIAVTAALLLALPLSAAALDARAALEGVHGRLVPIADLHTAAGHGN